MRFRFGGWPCLYGGHNNHLLSFYRFRLFRSKGRVGSDKIKLGRWPIKTEKPLLSPSYGTRLTEYCRKGHTMKKRVCRECGSEVVQSRKGPTSDFCSVKCRQAWKNRRMQRGAMLYDAIMNWRFNRKNGNDKAAWQAITRMAATFNQEDKDQRDGRRSYRPLKDVLQDNPWINSIHM